MIVRNMNIILNLHHKSKMRWKFIKNVKKEIPGPVVTVVVAVVVRALVVSGIRFGMSVVRAVDVGTLLFGAIFVVDTFVGSGDVRYVG